MSTATVSNLAPPEIELPTIGGHAPGPPEWERPVHKTVEREDWPSEWEDWYFEKEPDCPRPEPKCRPGLKVYKGYAAMSRAEFFNGIHCIHRRPFLLYLFLYHSAHPLGKDRGLVITSREELSDEPVVGHIRTLDDDLDTLEFAGFIDILTSAKG